MKITKLIGAKRIRPAAERAADSKRRKKVYSGKNYAPQGVIICSDKKAFLGMEHKTPPELSDDLIAKLKDISKHGLWYEGDGGDIPYTEHLFGPKRNYSGGFDDNLDKMKFSAHPPEFISALFSNLPPESIADYIVGNGTILEAMHAAGNKISSLKDGPAPTKEIIKSFLRSISNPMHRLDFLKMANELATKENAEYFIKVGAEEMWPSNWKNYPNPAGKIAKKANDYRDTWLASKSPNGLYVIGAGHLIAIAEYGKYKIIGGNAIQ
jgi:hypothetical protein